MKVHTLCLCILGGLSSLTANGEYAQLKFIDRRICHLGVINGDGMSITKRIYFWNPGVDTLSIDKLYKSCSCTEIELSKSILAPKDTAYIDIKIDPINKIGEQEIIVHMIANTDIRDHVIRVQFEVK